MVRYWLVPFGGIQMILKIVENPNERGFQFVQMLFGAYHGEKQVHLAFGHALTSPKNYQFIDFSFSLLSILSICLVCLPICLSFSLISPFSFSRFYMSVCLPICLSFSLISLFYIFYVCLYILFISLCLSSICAFVCIYVSLSHTYKHAHRHGPIDTNFKTTGLSLSQFV